MSEFAEEKAQQERRRRRTEAARREKERQRKIRRAVKIALPCAGIVLIGSILFTTISKISHKEKPEENTGNIENQAADNISSDSVTQDNPTQSDNLWDGAILGSTIAGTELNNRLEEAKKPEAPTEPAQPSRERFEAMVSADTIQPSEEEILSQYVVLLDADTGAVLAEREGMTRMNPASMTKVLTILVAAEHAPNLDDYVTITRDITDYSYVNDCSAVGFAENESVPVRDLFYGTILPSGADAAAALAIYTAGSLDAFVDLMNEKLEDLGLSETSHMTNCVGLYDADHYSTAYDIALILQAAVENDLCREALTAHKYTTTATTEHPEGIPLSNWFLRRIEDQETNGEVLYGKTGYVTESGSCAVSYQLNNNGKKYICVTGNAHGSWKVIYDHAALYMMCQ